MHWLRTEITGLDTWFAPIATAHFFAHVTHSSCITDDEGKQTWHPLGKGSLCVCSCEPRSSRKCQAISDSVNRQSLWEHRNDFTLLNARWPPFFFSWITSFPGSLPFLILSILTKKKICTREITNISPFMLSCDRSCFLS